MFVMNCGERSWALSRLKHTAVTKDGNVGLLQLVHTLSRSAHELKDLIVQCQVIAGWDGVKGCTSSLLLL
jgi:hypothetical protein